MSDATTKAEFLREKVRLIAPFLEPTFAAQMQGLFAQLSERAASMPDETFQSGDRELEKRMATYMTEEQIREIRNQLVVRFGFSSLGRVPSHIVRDVLLSGVIRSEDEARVVTERLGNQRDELDPAKRLELGRLLNTFRPH